MTTPPLDLPAERLTALRDIANAATEGPWAWNAAPVDTASGEGGESCIDAGTIGVTGDVYTDEDAEFIEAFDPPTVLALLDRVEEADGLLARLSASGGRNIDLLTRAEAAERDLAAVTVSRGGWQTRAKAAEKKVAAVRELRDKWFRELENPEHLVYLDTVINDLDYTLDTHTPETETAP